MVHNTTLSPPPSKPWMQDNTSSSSLRGMEIGLPPGQALPPPFPNTVMSYEAKPLPPVPHRSLKDTEKSFVSEISSAFRTPEQGNGSQVTVSSPQQASLSGSLSNSITQNTELPHEKFQTTVPRKSANKLRQIFGSGRALPLVAVEQPVPSGHNSREKVKQVMGVDLNAKHSAVPDIPPTSMISDASSVYSAMDMDTTVWPVGQMEEEPRGRKRTSSPETFHDTKESQDLDSPTFKPWRHPSTSPVPIPAHLKIVKENSRPSSQFPSLSLASKRRMSSRPERRIVRNGKVYIHDAYHAIALELARSTMDTPSPSLASSEISPRNTAYSHALPTAAAFRPLPSISKRQSSFSDRSYTSRVRVAPPVELSKLEHLTSAVYKAPIRSAYPTTPSTPHPQTGRWLSRAGSRARITPIGVFKPRKQSLLDRVLSIRRPSLVPAPSAETANSTGIAAPAPRRGPGPLKPPPRLRDRQFRYSAGPSRLANNNRNSKFISARPPPLPISTQPFKKSSGGRPLTPSFPKKKSPLRFNRERAMSPVTESAQESTDSRMTIDGDSCNTRRAAPEPLIDRSSVGTTISVWAAKTSELLGIWSQAERRRDSLKGKIVVGRDGGVVDEEGARGAKRFTGNLI